MEPQSAKKEFIRYIEFAGKRLDALSISEAVDLMFGFYVDVRATGCVMDEDGDMLLYQWGAYNDGEGEHFEFDLTRQFIENEGEDDDITQLSLTFKFDPVEVLQQLGRGNRWCANLEEVESFRHFILESSAYTTAAAMQPKEVQLKTDIAG